MHPVSDIRCSKGIELDGKKIVLCITGSIAAVECIKLARELVRYGADVHAVMTEWACRIIGPYSMEFATGNDVVTELTGKVEHVSFCGDVDDRADLVLVAPCTANTIGKMACGIDDTQVTTFLTTAIGTGIPVMVVPAMHETMYKHPVVLENVDRAKGIGVEFIQPVMEENKAKMADVENILNSVIGRLSGRAMAGKKVLIVTGATLEPIDDMRFLSNRATGRTGMSLAKKAFRMGADVILLAGENVEGIPTFIEADRFSTTEDLLSRIELLCNDHGDIDLAIFAAGISDYSPERMSGKIPSSEKEINIKLERTPKVIERFRKLFPDSFLVGFKAESVKNEKELMKRAYGRLRDAGMDLVVANDLSDVSLEKNTILTITPEKEVYRAEGLKEELAAFILEKCNEIIRGSQR